MHIRVKGNPLFVYIETLITSAIIRQEFCELSMSAERFCETAHVDTDIYLDTNDCDISLCFR